MSTNADESVARIEDALDRMLRHRDGLASLEEHALTQDEHGLVDRLDPHVVAGLGQEVRRQVADRRALGVPSLRERFAEVFEAWAETHPDDSNGEGLMAAFGESEAYDSWSELPSFELGRSLEDAFAAFCLGRRLLAPARLRKAHYAAVIRALAVDPEPAYALPPQLIGEPGRWILIDIGPPCVVYAAVGQGANGRVIEGPLPPLTAAVLQGEEDEAILSRFPVRPGDLERVRSKLRELGLLRGGATEPSTVKSGRGRGTHAP